MAQDIVVLDAFELGETPPLRIRMPAGALDERRIERLKAILSEFPGESPVYLDLGDNKVLRLHHQFCVNLDKAVGELRVAFGHDAIVL